MNPYWISLLLSFVLLDVFPQQLNFTNIGTHEGLPSSEVYSVIQDSKGYIWGTSDGGIFRYNGTDFKVFTKEDGLPDNSIFRLHEDKWGRIWMNGYNNRLAYIRNDSVFTIKANQALADALKKTRALIMSFGLDSNGVIYIGTYQQPYKIKPPYDKVETIIEQDFPTLRRFIFQLNTNTLITSSYTYGYNNKGFIKYKRNKLKILVTVKTKTINKTFVHYMEKNRSYSSAQYTCLLKDGSVLTSVENFLYHVKQDGSVVSKKFEHWIDNLYQDSDGGIWICFYRNGIVYFKSDAFEGEGINYFKGQTVTGVLEDREHGFWVSTNEKGIYYCSSKQVLQFTENSGLSGKILGLTNLNDTIFATNSKNEIYALIQNKVTLLARFYSPFEPEKLSIQTFNSKKYECGFSFSELNKNFQIKKQFKIEGSPVSVKAVAYISPNKFWLLTHSGLILLHNFKVEKEYNIFSRGKSVLLTQKNEVLIGTLEGLFQLRNDSVCSLFDTDKRLAARVTYLTMDNLGTVYNCTKGEGLLIRLKNGKWLQTTKAKGLNTTICNYVAFNTKGEIWMATNKGISRVYLTADGQAIDTIYNFDRSDGLIDKQVEYICLRGKEVWLGTRKGLMVINELDNLSNTTLPGIYVSRKTMNYSQTIDSSQHLFKYHQNTFTFYIDNLSFKKYREVSFLYRLKGGDKKFKVSNSHKIEYQNLPHGSYTLELMGINNNGVRTPVKSVYSFEIEEPFWQTWWFITLEILMAIALVWLIISLRVQKIKRNEKRQTQLNKRLSELQLTSLRARINPHFIFNAINGVQRYVLQKEKFETYTYLTKFSQLMRLILSNANRERLSLREELESIELYVEIEQLRFDDKFEFSCLVDPNLDQGELTIPSMIIQPFIENAIWHGIMPLPEDKKGRIELELKEKGDELHIRIQDNGIGRSASSKLKKDVQHQSLGLQLTAERLELIDRNIKNNYGRILISDVMDANHNVIGTCVELTIKL